MDGIKPIYVQKVAKLDSAQKADIRSNLDDALHTHGIGESSKESAEFKQSDYTGDKAAMFTSEDGQGGFLALRITDDGAAVIEHFRFHRGDADTAHELLQKAVDDLKKRGVREVIVRLPEKFRDVQHVLHEFNFHKEDEEGDMRTFRASI